MSFNYCNLCDLLFASVYLKLSLWRVVVMSCLIFYLLAFFSLQVKASPNDFRMPQYGNALTRATVEIIEKFYIERTRTLNIYHASNELNELNLERNLDTMNEVLYQVGSKIVIQLEDLDFKVTDKKRVHNIMFIDSLESFWSVFKLFSPNYFDYQGFYLILLITTSDEQYQIMANIFEFLWAEYIINVNIIWLAPQNDNEAFLYTYFPYTSFYCGKAVPIQLNQFRFGNWLHAGDFFPDKVSNLHGCPLTVATVSSPPFMILEKMSDDVTRTNGIDGVLLRVLSQRMNFSVMVSRHESQGEVYSNGTSNGEPN